MTRETIGNVRLQPALERLTWEPRWTSLRSATIRETIRDLCDQALAGTATEDTLRSLRWEWEALCNTSGT